MAGMHEIGTLNKLLQETAGSLKGYAKRLFMARTVEELFEGMAYRAEQELGWVQFRCVIANAALPGACLQATSASSGSGAGVARRRRGTGCSGVGRVS